MFKSLIRNWFLLRFEAHYTYYRYFDMKSFYPSKSTLIKFSLLLLPAILSLSISPLMAQRREAGAVPVDPGAAAAARRQAFKEDSAYVRDNYKKLEIMVPMRDGINLNTQ